MPRYRRYFSVGDWVFLTLVTADRRPWLRAEHCKRLLMQSFHAVKRQHGYRHLAHVVLDDHLHWMLIAPENGSVAAVVSSFKLGLIQRCRLAGRDWKRLWQPRYYDHILRNERDAHCHLDYIHYNPVKHGYVRAPRLYPWSSFHAWVRRGHYDASWGETEPPTAAGLDYEA